MEWAANITKANWVGLLQVSLFVFILLKEIRLKNFHLKMKKKLKMF